MDVRDLFSDQSDLYAEARPRYPTALYEWLVGCCAERRLVWDAGCGNGQAAADLRRYFDLVEATDISSSQIAIAPDYDQVRFSVQPAEATWFKDNSFDAVCVAQALHWFDFDKFWPEVKRVLRPHGVFAAWGYGWPRVDQAIDAALEANLLSVIEPYWSPRNRLLWDGYQNIPFPLEPIATPDIQLTLKWSLDQFFSYLNTWSATRRCIDEIGSDFFTASRDAIQALWGQELLGGEVRRDVSMDLVLVAGRSPREGRGVA